MENCISYTDNWVNVVQNENKYKELFSIPTEIDLDILSIKDTVKISNGFERFFVCITNVDGDTVYGTIENHLVGKYDYDYKDIVRFEKKNIFMIKKHDNSTENRKNKNGRTIRRMLKLLGIDPTEQSKDALAVISILQNKQ